MKRLKKEEEIKKAHFAAMTYEGYLQKQQEHKQQLLAQKAKYQQRGKEVADLKRRCEELEKKCDNVRKEVAKEETLDVRFLQDFGGLSRLTLSSDTWHAENPGAAIDRKSVV